jgi:single-stranded-DNA-specific exonuclease
LQTLPTPDFLPNIERFCDLMSTAVKNKQPICVVGDYDADGMSATALAVKCLQRMNATVSWTIPERQTHGYGLHPAIVESEAANGSQILLTVDNGINANRAIARAKELGLTVCVTDHHLPGDELPPADCLVNPRLGENHAGQNLAGVGVAFYAMAALRRHLGFDFDMSSYLDLVALGTVADCVKLDAINRALVGGGLARLRTGQVSPPLAALSVYTRSPRHDINCRDISFRLAPRLNAAGRFDKAALGVRFLLANDMTQARRLAAQLDTLNNRRIALMSNTMAEASALLDEHLPAGIVVARDNWLPGVLGLIAGQLCEKHHRPALAFSPHEGYWRGSGRAPKGWQLHNLIKKIATEGGVIPGRFGGHAEAVGVTVENIEKFADVFTRACEEEEMNSRASAWDVDAVPPPEEVTMQAVSDLQKLVWGEGFPPPRFAGEFDISQQRPLKGGHLQLQLQQGNWRLPAICFNRTQLVGNKIAMVFSLVNDRYTSQVSGIIEIIL